MSGYRTTELLESRGDPTELAPLIRGRVSGAVGPSNALLSAPSAFPTANSQTNLLWVVAPGYSVTNPLGPCRWSADHGATLPIHGAACVVALDDERIPTVLWWEGAQSGSNMDWLGEWVLNNSYKVGDVIDYARGVVWLRKESSVPPGLPAQYTIVENEVPVSGTMSTPNTGQLDPTFHKAPFFDVYKCNPEGTQINFDLIESANGTIYLDFYNSEGRLLAGDSPEVGKPNSSFLFPTPCFMVITRHEETQPEAFFYKIKFGVDPIAPLAGAGIYICQKDVTSTTPPNEDETHWQPTAPEKKGETGAPGNETPTWAIVGTVAAGVLPGPFQRIALGEKRTLIGFEWSIAEGEIEVTLERNGVAVSEATAITVKTGETQGLTFASPVELADKDRLTLKIIKVVGTTKGLTFTMFIET